MRPANKRRFLKTRARWLLWLSALSLLAACNDAGRPGPQTEGIAASPSTSAGEPTSGRLSAEDEIAIQAAVVRDLYLDRGDAIGGVPTPILYIARRIQGGGALEPASTPPPPRTLNATIQEGITAALADMPAELVWVESFQDVPFVEELHPGVDNGATIHLSHITLRDDGAALVEGSLTFACNCELGGGAFYVIERVDGRWRVTGIEAKWES